MRSTEDVPRTSPIDQGVDRDGKDNRGMAGDGQDLKYSNFI